MKPTRLRFIAPGLSVSAQVRSPGAPLVVDSSDNAAFSNGQSVTLESFCETLSGLLQSQTLALTVVDPSTLLPIAFVHPLNDGVAWEWGRITRTTRTVLGVEPEVEPVLLQALDSILFEAEVIGQVRLDEVLI